MSTGRTGTCRGCGRWWVDALQPDGRCPVCIGKEYEAAKATRETVTTQANPPEPVDWASKTADEILADINALTQTLPDPTEAYGPCQIIAPRETAEAILDVQGAPGRLRRTRVGRWVIDGRTYRTRGLALDSAFDRAAGRFFGCLVLRSPGRIGSLKIKGVVVT